MENPGVVLVAERKIIQVQSAFPIFPNFQNFSILTSSNGQTVFTLPNYPILTGLFSMNINGVTQDPLNGDFTVNGNILTVNASLVIGDKVAGFYQQMSSGISPAIMGYRTFFFVATQNQINFNIGFYPQAIIYIAVNGIVQSLQNGDYTVNGSVVSMSVGLNAGDRFFGLALT